jgi:hypothetical protein
LADDVNADVLHAKVPAILLSDAIHPLSRALGRFPIPLSFGKSIRRLLKLGHEVGWKAAILMDRVHKSSHSNRRLSDGIVSLTG